MKALLLSAGLGTRLRPITNHTPKCLVPIAGKPLLEYWLDSLSTIGINEFLINTHYLSEQVIKYVKESKYKNKITLSYEEELLNTGGTLLKNKDFFENKPFLLIHADNLSFCDFEKFISTYHNRPKYCDITMMLFKTDIPKSCGIVKLNENGIVEEFYEKVHNPPSNLANGAVYILDYSVINYLEKLDKEEIDFSLEVIPHYLGKINTYLNTNYHKDIGTIRTYLEAQEDIKKFKD